MLIYVILIKFSHLFSLHIEVHFWKFQLFLFNNIIEEKGKLEIIRKLPTNYLYFIYIFNNLHKM
jgi:hypothetical protein